MDRQRAIVLHGMPSEDEYYSEAYPSASNSHWIPWLQKQLLIRAYDAQTPEIPDAFNPEYDVWSSEFQRHMVDEPMVLVGHSCGAGFLIRWLTENADVFVDKLVLIAPWLDPNRDDTTDFFDFEIDEDLIERVDSIHLFYSTDDSPDIQTSVDMVLEHLPDVIQHRYSSMGHFTSNDMGTEEFPDLLDVFER